MFGLELSELASRSLIFYTYATDKYSNTLIGEAELKVGEMDLVEPLTTWLPLTDTGNVRPFLYASLSPISILFKIIRGPRVRLYV